MLIWLLANNYAMEVGMQSDDLLGWVGSVASVLYQCGVLPWEALNNRIARKVRMPFFMAVVSAVSYTAATARAVIQPDWFDFWNRVGGALFSLVILDQIFLYMHLSLSRLPPFVVYQTSFGHDIGKRCRACRDFTLLSMKKASRCEQARCKGYLHIVKDVDLPSTVVTICDVCEHRTRYWFILEASAVSGPYFWIKNGNGGWRHVNELAYKRAHAEATGITARLEKLPNITYFNGRGMTGIISNKIPDFPFTWDSLRKELLKLVE
jgi:hypothetical protein